MASKAMDRTYRIFRAKSSRGLGVLAYLALAWVASCSLRNLDELGPGDSTAGGTSSIGGAGNRGGGNSGGAANLNGGTSAYGGAANPNTSGGAGGGAQAGATGTGGTIARSETTGKQICPVYTSPNGTLVTPPSNDFESEALEWSTINERAYIVSTVAKPESACLGKQYLSCDGSMRVNASDGPGIEVVSYVTPGHLYTLNVAARFSSLESSATGVVKITVARGCEDAARTVAYQSLISTPVDTTWTRIVVASPFSTTFTGCNTGIMGLFIYFETEGVENATRTIELDDFQLWDVTGSGGAGGAAGMAGSAGVAGNG